MDDGKKYRFLLFKRLWQNRTKKLSHRTFGTQRGTIENKTPGNRQRLSKNIPCSRKKNRLKKHQFKLD